MKNILVTCALPYSNGPIHLGHILEHIQADIWVRFNRLIGNNVYFICADDSHGTPIMLSSRKLNISPELMINNVLKEHKKHFLNFGINHDLYFTTHSKENYYYSILLFEKFHSLGLLKKKNISQYYDVLENIFLPDRLIKGKCPKCYKDNQYGDSCSFCNCIYNSNELINPISLISNTKPILRRSKHIFLNVNYYKNILRKWISICNLQNEIKNQLLYWLNNRICDWNISRDFPYFGFKIPDFYLSNKYFYVWWDALLCYISSFKYFCDNVDKSLFNDFWHVNSTYEVYNFIGKDILYFHGLLWPIILHVLKFRKPTGLVVHGHLMINGEKMSKSLNNFITTEKWLSIFDIDSLRFYFASKLSYKIKDINLSIRDYIKTVNSELINKFINIASRISKFFEIYFDLYLSNELLDINFYNFFIDKSNLISNYFLNFNYSKLIIEINILLNILNKYINDKKPWSIDLSLSKNKIYLHNLCTTVINIFRVISIYLYPIIPNISIKIENFLNVKLSWNTIRIPLLNHRISKYKKIITYVDKSLLNKLF